MPETLGCATELSVTPVTGNIGAVVQGVNLNRHLDLQTRDAIWQAMLAYKVLFFRQQSLNHKEHVALGNLFGQLTRRPPPHNGIAPTGYPEILTVDSKIEDARYGEDFEERYRLRWLDYNAGWHTDLTPAVNPPAASILRAEAVTSFGGDTQWTDLEAAYANLSSPVQRIADTLRAEHAFFAGCQMLQYDDTDVSVLKLNNDYPLVANHPVVRVHPETGVRCLFTNPASTNRIVGLTPSQSRQLLALFFEQISRPEFTVRWRWSVGDVVFWDNRNTAHLSPADAGVSGERRTLYRVTILGDTPVGADGAASTMIAGEPFTALPIPFNERTVITVTVSSGSKLALGIDPVAGLIGAEVRGLDLSQRLDAETIERVRSALLKYKVLFFPDQSLNHATQVAFARQFGPLISRARPQTGAQLDRFPQVWTISPEVDIETYGFDHENHYRSRQHSGFGGWHTDLSTAVNPPSASILRCESSPTYGGDTQWTNLAAAYAGLPQCLQAFLDGLQAEHTFFAAYSMSPYDPLDRKILDQVNSKPQIAIHPVVRVHPETGEKSLFVNPARVNRIIGLSPMESKHILSMLFREVTQPGYTVRYSWKAGSVAFWDNRCTAHMGIGDYAQTGQPRRLHRVTLHGDRPVGPDGFESFKVVGRELIAHG